MNKLMRYPDKGYLGGVCHGLSEYTYTDPILWRILAICTPSLWAYLLLWIFLKKKK